MDLFLFVKNADIELTPGDGDDGSNVKRAHISRAPLGGRLTLLYPPLVTWSLLQSPLQLTYASREWQVGRADL